MIGIKMASDMVCKIKGHTRSIRDLLENDCISFVSNSGEYCTEKSYDKLISGLNDIIGDKDKKEYFKLLLKGAVAYFEGDKQVGNVFTTYCLNTLGIKRKGAILK